MRVDHINSGEFCVSTPKGVDQNSLVIGISTRSTAETIAAIQKAAERGAVTLALSGFSDSKTALSAKYFLTNFHNDDWYKDLSLGSLQ